MMIKSYRGCKGITYDLMPGQSFPKEDFKLHNSNESSPGTIVVFQEVFLITPTGIILLEDGGDQWIVAKPESQGD